MKYEIQTYTLCAGWINIWSENDAEPVTFNTREAAEKDLADYLAELEHARQLDHLEDYNPEDFKIVKVPA
jgi:hypothetical protein